MTNLVSTISNSASNISSSGKIDMDQKYSSFKEIESAEKQPLSDDMK